jgi:hypothetical protein
MHGATSGIPKIAGRVAGNESGKNPISDRLTNPEASFPPSIPAAGVCLHITALSGDFGIVEIGASARRFVDTLADMQMRVWQFLPLGPTAYGDLPYQPLSTFAGNGILIDV